jgi:hypothetical protein
MLVIPDQTIERLTRLDSRLDSGQDIFREERHRFLQPGLPQARSVRVMEFLDIAICHLTVLVVRLQELSKPD